jgi:hypothetical protein
MGQPSNAENSGCDRASGYGPAPVKLRRVDVRRWGASPLSSPESSEVTGPFRRIPLAPLAFAALTAAGALAPSSLGAQAAPAASAADSLAFPRKVFAWFRQGQADSLFAHAAEPMKTRMQSAANVTAMMGQLAAQIGAYKSTEGEYQFEKEGRKVYIAVARHETAPELAAHVIQYVPGSSMFERFGAMPLTRAKEMFPEAKLP